MTHVNKGVCTALISYATPHHSGKAHLCSVRIGASAFIEHNITTLAWSSVKVINYEIHASLVHIPCRIVDFNINGNGIVTYLIEIAVQVTSIVDEHEIAVITPRIFEVCPEQLVAPDAQRCIWRCY